MIFDDTGCARDMKSQSEYEIDSIEKFVPPEIGMLNACTKHCEIHSYYTMDGILTVCTSCMADIYDGGMYFVRKHETGSFG